MILNDSLVLENKCICKDIFKMKLKGNFDAKAGQFINIKINDNTLLLRRPISIYNATNDYIEIIYRIAGEGTKLLSNVKENEYLNILGPLGNGFPISSNKNVLIIGGGIGVPPLYQLAKELKDCNITFVLGFRNEENVILEQGLKQYGKVIVSTDDGSYGFHGNVLEAIDNFKVKFDLIYACGPSKMLEFIDKKYNGKCEGYISFEERMACGLGICYGCVCKPKTLKDGMLRVCKEGPVFPLGVISYE